MNITDRVAYIRGMAQGMEMDYTTPVGKIIEQIIEALDETAQTIGDLQESYEDLNEYVESIDDDLVALEDEVQGDDFDEDDEDDDDEDFEDFDGFDEDDEDIDEEYEGFVYGVCPACHGLICAGKMDAKQETLFDCPHCDKQVEPKWTDFEHIELAVPVDDDEE